MRLGYDGQKQKKLFPNALNKAFGILQFVLFILMETELHKWKMTKISAIVLFQVGSFPIFDES